MRRSITRSCVRSAFSSNANKCYYSTTHVVGDNGEPQDLTRNFHARQLELDSKFSEVYKTFASTIKDLTKDGSAPSFSEMLTAVTGNPLLMSDVKGLEDKARDVFAKGGIERNTDGSTKFVPREKPVRIAVTGAAGAIGYALLFRLASGQLLGPHQPIILQCLEIPAGLPAMEGVKMELIDCAFPLLRGVEVTDSPERAFDGVEYTFLVGAQPRVPGLDRVDLLKKNAGIFSVQGKALNKTASRSVKTLVVGNPANTNCLITANNAPDIDPTQFSAMTRLDHNRGIAQLSERLSVPVTDIKKFAIWGNHSDSQFPDVSNTLIGGKSARELIGDNKWITDTFIPKVAKRGAAIMAARKVSSAASAANAAIDQMRDWALGSNGEWVSMAVWTGTKGTKVVPYGADAELYFSYPVICDGGKYTIVDGVRMDEEAKKRMKATNDELIKERSDAGELAVRQPPSKK